MVFALMMGPFSQNAGAVPEATIIVGQVSGAVGSTIAVPINISGLTNGLSTVQFTLNYDSSKLQPTIVSPATNPVTRGEFLLNAGGSFVANSETAGQVSVALADTNPTGAEGTMFVINFQILTEGAADLTLNLSDLYDIDLNLIAANVTNGSVTGTSLAPTVTAQIGAGFQGVLVGHVYRTSQATVPVEATVTAADGTTLTGVKAAYMYEVDWPTNENWANWGTPLTLSSGKYIGTVPLAANVTNGIPEVLVAAQAQKGTSYYIGHGLGVAGSLLVYRDTLAPEGSVTINGTANTAYSLDVQLQINCQDEFLKKVEVSNDQTNWTDVPIANIASPVNWTLSAGAEGTRTVYVRLTDDVGNAATINDTIQYQALNIPTPAADKASEDYYNTAPLTVKFTNTADADVYYTLDGTEPSNTSIAYNAESGIQIAFAANPVILKAIAYKQGHAGAVASYTYSFKDIPVPALSGVSNNQTFKVPPASIAFAPAPADGVIKYTEDGSDPTTSTTAKSYTAPISYDSSQSGVKTIKAVTYIDATYGYGQAATFNFTLDFRNYNNVINGWALLQKAAVLTQAEAQTSMNIARMAVGSDKANSILSAEEWNNIESVGTAKITHAELLGVMDVFQNQLISNWTAFQNAVSEQDYLWLINFEQQIKDTLPANLKAALIAKGISASDMVQIALNLTVNQQLFSLNDQLNINDVILHGVDDLASKDVLAAHGINWENVNQLVGMLTPEQKQTLQISLEKLDYYVIPPIFSLASGSYMDAQSVTLSAPVTAGTIYYTIGETKSPLTSNGTLSTDAVQYTTAIQLPKTTANTTSVIKAVRQVNGKFSYMGSATYTILGAGIPVPVITPAGGTFNQATAISAADYPLGTIYFTKEVGATVSLDTLAAPTNQSTAYTAPITVNPGERAVMKFIGYVNGQPSTVVGYTYEVLAAPTAAPAPAGPYSSKQTVSLSCTNSGAVMYYTLDGSNPTLATNTARKVYAGLINISNTSLLQAVAYKNGVYSQISSYNYPFSLGSISGTVTYHGAALAAQTVKLKQGGSVIKTTATLSDGSFSFPGLFNGTYSVVAGGTNDFSPSSEQTIIIDSAANKTANITLYKGGTISGKVNYNGSGKAGVEVSASSAVMSGSAVTADDGSFWIEGLATAADYVVQTYNSFGLVDAKRTGVSVTNGALTDLTAAPLVLTDPPQASVTGTVTQGGNPVADVQVSFYSPSTWAWGQGATDNTGTYTITGLLPAADYEIYYYKWDSNLYGSLSGQNLNQGANTLNVQLPPTYSISGTVTDDSNPAVPLSGISIWAFSDTGGYGWAETDANGAFSMANLIPGTYTLEIDSWASFYVDNRTASEKKVEITNQSVAGQNIQLMAGGIISGKVITNPAGGQAAVNVSAWSNNAGVWRSVTTDANGDYTIRGVKDANDYIINANKYPYLTATLNNVTVNTAAGNTTGQNMTLVHRDLNAAYFTGDGNWLKVVTPDVVPGQPVQIKLDYKNNNSLATGAVTAQFTVPADITGLTAQVNGTAVVPTVNGTTVSVPVGVVNSGVSGSVILQGVLNSATTALSMQVDASMEWGSTIEALGTAIIDVVRIELNGPTYTKPGLVTVYGKCAEGAKVTIFGKKQGQTAAMVLGTATAEGKWWSAQVDLQTTGLDVYDLYTVAEKGNTVSDPSKTLTVTVQTGAVTLIDATVNAAWNRNVKANKKIKIPAIAVSQGYEVLVDALFDGNVQVDNGNPILLFGLNSNVQASDAARGDFKVSSVMSGSGTNFSGSFTIPYDVSGDIKAFIRYQTAGEWQTEPIVQIQILIDPSGQVTDAHSGLPVAGVTAVCEVQIGGEWQRWAAENYGQVNPQTTDANGKYGWDVPAGTYRVVFSKADYQTYVSQSIVVPPPKTDLNPGIISLVSLAQPGIRSFSPADDASGVAWTAPIQVEFTKDMDIATMTGNIEVAEGGNPAVAGTIAAVNATTYTFTPTAPLGIDKTYTVTLKNGIKDTFGNAIDQYQWSFRTMENVTLVTADAQLNSYANSTATRSVSVSITGQVLSNVAIGDGATVDISIIDAAAAVVGTIPGVPVDKVTGNFSTTWVIPVVAAEGTYALNANYNAIDYPGGTFDIVAIAAPTANPAAGTYSSAQSVSLATTTPGASIYYTVDGSVPTTGSSLYAAPVNVAATTTIKAIAVKSGVSSEVATFTYTISSGSSSSGGGTVIPKDDGKATAPVTAASGANLTTDDNNFAVKVPAGAVTTASNVTITRMDGAKKIAPTSGMNQIANLQYQVTIADTQGKALTETAKPMTLTFNYKTADLPSGTSAQDLKACYWNTKQAAWIVVPTTVNAAGNEVVATSAQTAVYALMAMPNFPALGDVKGHWAEANVLKIVSLGIASGDPNGAYRPEANITREEFAKLVVLTAGLTPEANPALSFADADQIAPWARGYVAAAVKAGIIKGYSDGSFGGKRNISRAEISAMVVRALGEQTGSASTLNFTDAASVPDWAASYVGKAVEKGIVNGFPDNSFKALENATRAQSAKMISTMLDVK
jgi:hypothetical protein